MKNKHGYIHLCHPHVRLLKNNAFISCINFLVFFLKFVALGNYKLVLYNSKNCKDLLNTAFVFCDVPLGAYSGCLEDMELSLLGINWRTLKQP